MSATRRSNDLDFYGDRPASGLPSLEQFLVDTDYARLMWWPQRHFDRLVVWQARRARVRAATPAPPLPRNRALSRRLADSGLDRLHRAGQPGSAGARDRARESAAPRKDRGRLERAWAGGCDDSFHGHVDPSHGDGHDKAIGAARSCWARRGWWWSSSSSPPATACSRMHSSSAAARSGQAAGRAACLNTSTPLLAPFVSTGKDGAPATQEFCDRGFMGLPLDNQMDDLLMPTWFTELWVPFTPGDGRLQETIARLRRCFDADGTAQGAYAATGAFAFELYVAKADHTFLPESRHGEPRLSRRRVLVRKQPGQPRHGLLSSILEGTRAARLPIALGKVPAATGRRPARPPDRAVSELGKVEGGSRARRSERPVPDQVLAGAPGAPRRSV